jgi:hypothetical protein
MDAFRMAKEEAMNLVKEGYAFIITEQAIGSIAGARNK